MTATDLHQRMLHLLDRAKTMSAGDRAATRPAASAITSASPSLPLSRPAMTEPAPMAPPVHYGTPSDSGSSAMLQGHPAGQAPEIHIPEVAPREPEASDVQAGDEAANGAEDRGEARQKVLRRGKITWQSGNFEIECQVRDLSTTGAKLRLAGDVTTPSCFSIIIYPEKITKMAQVCWRDELTLGVQFIND